MDQSSLNLTITLGDRNYDFNFVLQKRKLRHRKANRHVQNLMGVKGKPWKSDMSVCSTLNLTLFCVPSYLLITDPGKFSFEASIGFADYLKPSLNGSTHFVHLFSLFILSIL